MASDSLSDFDFSVYRRPELFEKIGALISVPRTLTMIVKCGLVSVVPIAAVWWLT